MPMAAVTLAARPRAERGKNAARKLRREGLVPAVLYGHGDETRAVSIDAHDLERLLATVHVVNTLINLQIEGGALIPALIREIHHHPVRPGITHVDLFLVHAGEKLKVEIPVRLHGQPVGVRDFQGILAEVLHSLEVECLPGNIPEGIDVDVSGLNIGDSVHVRDVSVPDARILNDPEATICTVTQPTAEALPVGTQEADGVGGDVQPQLIRRRSDAGDADEG